MSNDWQGLVGTFGQMAGTAGTATLPAGASLILLSVHSSVANATFQIFPQGPAVAVINGAAPLVYEFPHLLIQANSVNGGTITFTNTDHYYIQFFRAGHT